MKLSSAHPIDQTLRKQSPGGSGRWGRFEFHHRAIRPAYDFWIVCDQLSEPEVIEVPPTNVVLITWEPPDRVYKQGFIDQFGAVMTSDRNIRHPNVHYAAQGQPWHLGRTLDELRDCQIPKKTKLMSIITSDKRLYPGHAVRLEFAHALHRALGGKADIHGRGISSFSEKWDVLAPYRYSLCMENSSVPDYLTEKLPDCFLAYTFPFYWGAPNADDYFPPESYMALNLEDPTSAIETITQTIKRAGHWESRVDAVKAARAKYLEEESFFPMVANFLLTHFDPSAMPASVRLEPEAKSSTVRRLISRMRTPHR